MSQTLSNIRVRELQRKQEDIANDSASGYFERKDGRETAEALAELIQLRAAIAASKAATP